MACLSLLTRYVALAAAALLAAGCGGGGGGGSAEDEVKDTVTEFFEAVIDGRNGEACALTTDPEECLGSLVLAQGFLGEGGFEAFLGEDWREKLEAAEVTFADDDHATIPPLFPDDEEASQLVREDGRWLIVLEEETGEAEQPTSLATDTVATTEEEPADLTASVGETLTLAGNEEGLQVEVTLLKVVDPAKASDEFLAPGKGKRYAAFQLRLANVGDVLFQDSPSNGAVVIDTEDQQFAASFFDAVEPGFGSLRIRPGDERVGYITFEVPKAAKLRTFQFTLDSGFGPETGEWELG